MPPMKMTRAAPTAMIPMSETWLMMLVRLRAVRKYGDRNDSTMTMAIRPNSGPGIALSRSATRVPNPLSGWAPAGGVLGGLWARSDTAQDSFPDTGGPAVAPAV